MKTPAPPISSASSGRAPDAPAFEELLADAARLANLLESGALPLEKALEAYAEGVQKLRGCEERLREMEKRAQALLPAGDGFRLEPIEAAEEET